jgi:acetyltransferase-like isoleucine patch superfamily enzyme
MSPFGTFLRKYRSMRIRLWMVWWSSYYTFYLGMHPGVRVGRSLKVSGRVHWMIDPAGTLVIGDNVRINSGPVVNAFGGHRRMIICVLPGGKLVIGEGAGLSSSTLVCQHSIEIHRNTMIGGGCDIVDTDFHPADRAARLAHEPGTVRTGPVSIGPGAWVGGKVLILKGVTIGAAAVVGAGSVVTRSVPRGEVWAGNPARPLPVASLNFLHHDA